MKYITGISRWTQFWDNAGIENVFGPLFVSAAFVFLLAFSHAAHHSNTTITLYDFVCANDFTGEVKSFNKAVPVDIDPDLNKETWYPQPIEDSMYYTRCARTTRYTVPK